MTDTAVAATVTAPAAPAVPALRAERGAVARGLLAGARPRQWVKGLLVLAAPLAADRWTGEVLLGASIAFLAFTATSAGCYLLNDVHDAAADRLHPRKRLRPVASGLVPTWLAVAVGSVLVVAGPAIAFATDREALGLIVAGYGVLTTAYTGGLKTVPGLEVLVVSSGFVLRPLAGAAGSGVPPSAWFLGVCCSGALMVALGKRYAEIHLTDPVAHRPVLAAYSGRGLRRARTAAAFLLVGTYAGWAVTRAGSHLPLALVSAAVVVLATARYLARSDRGDGGEPERLLFADPALLACAAVWAVCFLAPLRG